MSSPHSKRSYSIDPARAQERARVASLSRSRASNDPDLVSARQRLRDARVDEYINKLVSEAPPLNDHQRRLLAGLLQPLPTEGGKAA